jgi:hypothetical protein
VVQTRKGSMGEFLTTGANQLVELCTRMRPWISAAACTARPSNCEEPSLDLFLPAFALRAEATEGKQLGYGQNGTGFLYRRICDCAGGRCHAAKPPSLPGAVVPETSVSGSSPNDKT